MSERVSERESETESERERERQRERAREMERDGARHSVSAGAGRRKVPPGASALSTMVSQWFRVSTRVAQTLNS